jgi:hypothetical protein
MYDFRRVSAVEFDLRTGEVEFILITRTHE